MQIYNEIYKIRDLSINEFFIKINNFKQIEIKELQKNFLKEFIDIEKDYSTSETENILKEKYKNIYHYIKVFQLDNNLYIELSKFLRNSTLEKLFINNIKDFSYWNTDKKPDDITDIEWEQRSELISNLTKDGFSNEFIKIEICQGFPFNDYVDFWQKRHVFINIKN